MPPSLVVRFTAVDPAYTVELFQEQEPGHRVGERHLRERESHIAPGQDCWRKPEISADNKRDLVLPGQLPLTERFGKLLA